MRYQTCAWKQYEFIYIVVITLGGDNMMKFTKAGILALAAVVGLGVSTAQAGSAKNGYDKQKSGISRK